MSKTLHFISSNCLRIGKIVLITLICVVVVWQAVSFFNGFRRKTYLRNKRIVSTLRTLRALAIDVCWVTSISGEQPPTEIDSLVDFVFRHDPQIKEKRTYIGRWLDTDTNSVVDRWHNPVKLSVESSHNYKLISPGPNEQDDEGKGDDIIYEFDPWEWFREPNERK